MTRLASRITDWYVRGMQFFNLNWLGRDSEDATAEMLKKLLLVCPGCDLLTSEFHAYGKLSCVISEGKPDSVQQIITQMNNRRWAELASQNEFDAFQEALVIYVVICAQSSGGAAIAISNPSGLYESNSILHVLRLTNEEIAQVRPLLSVEKPV